MATKSGQQEPEKAEIVEELLDALDTALDRVKVLYEQYFLGIQKQPPTYLHTDIERKIRDLAQLQIRNTALRYRYATLQQKFGSYNSYWRRTLRQIENGTYTRNLSKIGRQAARTGAAVPEEILAAMPKRMREQVKRDRDAALALAQRRGQSAESDELLTLADEEVEIDVADLEPVAFIGESTDVRRNVLTAGAAHRVNEDDADFDLDAFFAKVTSEGEPDPLPIRATAPAQRRTRTGSSGHPRPAAVSGTPAVAVPTAARLPTPTPAAAVPQAASAARSSGEPAGARSGPASSSATPPHAVTAALPTRPVMPPRVTAVSPPAGSQRVSAVSPPVGSPRGSGASPTVGSPRVAGERDGDAAPAMVAAPASTAASPAAPVLVEDNAQTSKIPVRIAPPPIPPARATQALPRLPVQPARAAEQPPQVPDAAPSKPVSLAPSQATRPLTVAPGAAAARPASPVETLAGPFPRIPSIPSIPPPPRPATAAASPSAEPPRAAPSPRSAAAASPAAEPAPAAPPRAERTPATPSPTVTPPSPTVTPPSPAATAARPKSPRPPGERPISAPRQPPPPGMSDADVNALYAKYVQAKQILGEEAGPGAYSKLLKTINAQAPKIMEQYKSKGVDFSVVVKDNQVIIRAKPKP